MRNRDVADILWNMGTLLEISGDNIFKVRAYYKASENIKNLTEDIAKLRAENRLAEIAGVGKAIEEKIGEYLDTGKISVYEDIKKEMPETLLDIVHVPSIGPKKAKLFFDELKIKDLEGLKEAAQKGELLKLPGVQQKTVDNILKGLAIVKEGQERMNLGLATKTAENIIEHLKKFKEVDRISTAGSLRRGKETIRDIDILITSDSPEKIMDVFVKLPEVKEILAHGATKSSIRTKDNVQVDLRVVDKNVFGAALLYFTGSKEFNVVLRQIAKKKNKKVNEYGIFNVKQGKEILTAAKTEEECFKALGLKYVEPELREEAGIKDLLEGQRPELIEQKDIKGDLHVHSIWSDGKNTIEEMVLAAQACGYQYLAICDHSAGLRIARGVSAKDLIEKKKEIDKLNKKYKNFRILFGSEVEIDKDGNLDYNDTILSAFDIVVAAVHTGFEQPQEQLTRRIVKACQNRHVNIIAHPTGVHLGKREPYPIDFDAVCQAAVDYNVCLEINAFPIRLDLNSSNIYFAKNKGVRFSIDTDSHSVNHLGYMRFGISIARRGWVTAKDVINTLSADKFLKAVSKK